MLKHHVRFSLLLCSALLAFMVLPEHAAALEPAQTPTPVTGSVFEITRALRQHLQGLVEDVAAKPHKPKVVNSRAAAITITLGLYDDELSTTQLVKVRKSGKTITTLDSSGYQFTLVRDNGVNSEFRVVGKPNIHVLAVIYPIFTSIGTTRAPKFRLDDTVYAPYSAYLNRPEIVAAGADYLTTNVQAVFVELKNLGARSRAYPEALLTDSVSPTVVSAIIAIEHASAQAFLDDPAGSLNTFYVTLAINQNQAFAYARSTASARGLVQFIPSTYQSIVKRWPQLGLYPNFEHGMVDPYNAIKAEVALLDDNLAALPAEVRLKNMGDDAALGAYLAAIYNGGTARVKRAIKQWGETWALDQTSALASLSKELGQTKAELKSTKAKLNAGTTLTKEQKAKLNTQVKALTAKVAELNQRYTAGKAAVLKKETVQYVAKFRVAYAHFAGPVINENIALIGGAIN